MLSLDPGMATYTRAASRRPSAVLDPFELVRSSPRTSALERAGGSERVFFWEAASFCLPAASSPRPEDVQSRNGFEPLQAGGAPGWALFVCPLVTLSPVRKVPIG